ncbi:MAG: hypothetical protein LC799_07535, partial [Actinobacteria bacterium]|nr:hypothetical protein [Actinomycetota bacterium]
TKSDQVDGAIGELSAFHETYGYYAQGVSITTAILPRGWQSRLVVLDSTGTAPGRGHCLDPHDCVVAKLVAGREKDFAFAEALIRERLIDPKILSDRVEGLDGAHPLALQRIINWLKLFLS